MARTPSPRLFLLVKSLSTSEKRYFSIFAARHVQGKANKYQQLFDAIEEQEKFDAEALKQAVYGKAKLKSNKYLELSRYLYDLLLQALRMYHAERSMQLQLQNELQNVEILYKRSLYANCRDSLRRIKKRAKSYQKWAVLLQVADWEKRIAYAESNIPYLDKELNRIQEEEKGYLENLSALSDYWQLFFQLYLHVRKYSVVRSGKRLEYLQELMQHPRLQQQVPALYHAKILYHRVYSLYYYSIGEAQAYYERNQELLELAQSDWHLVEENPSQYISIITNLLYSCAYLKRYDDLESYLELFRAVPITSLDDKTKITNQYYLNRLFLYIERGEFEQGRQLIEEVEQQRKELPLELYDATYFALYGYLCFGAEDYQQALSWFERLMDNAQQKEREDLQSVVRMLVLITHYELGNTLFLEYLLRSTYRFLRNRERLFEFERLVLRYIRRSGNALDKTAQQALFIELRDAFEALKGDPVEGVIFEYFDFIAWLESKIQGCSLTEVVQRRFQKQQKQKNA